MGQDAKERALSQYLHHLFCWPTLMRGKDSHFFQSWVTNQTSASPIAVRLVTGPANSLPEAAPILFDKLLYHSYGLGEPFEIVTGTQVIGTATLWTTRKSAFSLHVPCSFLFILAGSHKHKTTQRICTDRFFKELTIIPYQTNC